MQNLNGIYDALKVQCVIFTGIYWHKTKYICMLLIKSVKKEKNSFVYIYV